MQRNSKEYTKVKQFSVTPTSEDNDMTESDTESEEEENTEKMAEIITKETFQPLIESFFNKLSREQRIWLQSGTPDMATKCLLADLILEFIILVSKALVRAIQTRDVALSEESVKSCVGEMLPESFAELLDIAEEVQCKFSEKLASTISTEAWKLCESAKSASCLRMGKRGWFNRNTGPRMLNNMVNDACKMLKNFMTKRRRKSSPGTCSDQEGQVTERSDDSSQLPESLKKEILSQISSEDSFVIKTSIAAQKIIKKDLGELVGPLLADVPQAEYDQLQSHTLEEIESVSEQIASIISSMKETDDEIPRSSSPRKGKPPLKKVGLKIKKVFTNTFFMAWLQRIVAELRSKFRRELEPESQESVKSLAESICSLFEHGDTQHEGRKVSVTAKFSIPDERVRIFNEQLSDLLYNYITSGTTVIPATTCVPRSHNDLYDEIQSKVWILIVLLDWWMKTQAGSHSQNLARALTGPESQALIELSQSMASSSQCKETHAKQKQEAMDKLFVEVLMEKLLTRIVKKAKIESTRGQEELVDHLVELAWAELEGETITRKTFNKLDKKIFNELRKMWGPADMMLVFIKAKEPEMIHSIVDRVRVHLTKSSKCCNICRFFSSVRRAFSKPFRALFRRS